MLKLRTMTKKNLDSLRDKVDFIDKKLVHLLAERFKIIKKIAKYKKRHNLPIMDFKRVKEMQKLRLKFAKPFRVPPKMITHIFKDLINFSMNEEKKM